MGGDPEEVVGIAAHLAVEEVHPENLPVVSPFVPRPGGFGVVCGLRAPSMTTFGLFSMC
jgi:hypothetical protein